MFRKKDITSAGEFRSPAKSKFSKLLKCRCSTGYKDFIIRLDKKAGEKVWRIAYGFPMKPGMENESFASAEREKLMIETCTEYNGCPYCGNTVNCFCSCGGIFCADGDGTGTLTCPVCGETNEFAYYGNSFDVKSSSY
jgi:hypothetical protein